MPIVPCLALDLLTVHFILVVLGLLARLLLFVRLWFVDSSFRPCDRSSFALFIQLIFVKSLIDGVHLLLSRLLSLSPALSSFRK